MQFRVNKAIKGTQRYRTLGEKVNVTSYKLKLIHALSSNVGVMECNLGRKMNEQLIKPVEFGGTNVLEALKWPKCRELCSSHP